MTCLIKDCKKKEVKVDKEFNWIKVEIKPESLLDLKKKYPDLFYDQSWHDNEKFAKDKPKARTLWIREIPDSRNKTWDKQLKLSKDEVPSVNEVVQALVQHYLETGERLLENSYVRVNDLSDGHRVLVGGFDGDGMYVPYRFDDDRHSLIGLAASRSSKPRDLESSDSFEDLNLRVSQLEQAVERHEEIIESVRVILK